MIKKTIYIALFVLLGVILQGLVHVGLEVWWIDLLVGNFDKYNLGLSWAQWFSLHSILTIILFVMGIIFGLWQGVFWWKIIYIEKRLQKLRNKYKKLFFKKHEKK